MRKMAYLFASRFLIQTGHPQQFLRGVPAVVQSSSFAVQNVQFPSSLNDKSQRSKFTMTTIWQKTKKEQTFTSVSLLSNSCLSKNTRHSYASNAPLPPPPTSDETTTTAQQESGYNQEGGKGWRERAEEFNERYSKPLIYLHWFGAAGIGFLMGSALIAGSIPNDPKETSKEKLKFRGQLMHLHESVGLLMFAMIIPRIGVRLITKIPKELPIPTWQQYASRLSHALLYGAMIFMPVSGLAFGYFSCWGVPFFWWNVPGAPKEKYGDTYKALEKFFYENHHRVGNILTYYLVPTHIGAVAFHYLFRGHNILKRMNPFAKQALKSTK